MDFMFLLGRILFSLLFLSSAAGHLSQSGQMGGYAEGRGVKPGQPLVLLSGVALAVGGLGVLLGVWMDLAALVLAVTLLSFAVLMHPFWRDPQEQRQAEQIQFMKDLSLAGASLVVFYIARMDGQPFTITDGLF